MAVAVQHRPAGERVVTNLGWLDSRAGLRPGERVGPLLSATEDRIRAGSGYPHHVHAPGELVAWVLAGSLVHRPSGGTPTLLDTGQVQVLRTGVGFTHRESNDGWRLTGAAPAEQAVRLVQLQLAPPPAGTWLPASPMIRQLRYDPAPAQAELSVVHRRPDAHLAIAVLPAGTRVRLATTGGGYLFLGRGQVELAGGGRLGPGDGLVVAAAGVLSVSAPRSAAGSAQLLWWASH